MKKHILVADDEEVIRDIIQQLLEKKGYQVTAAADGQDALEKAQHEAFDLYITDVKMPRLDGYGFIKELKKIHPLAVIIVLTGFSSINGAVKSIHQGAYQYLSKPVKGVELYEAVEKALQYAEELYGPLQKSFDPGSGDIQQGEPIILHGFSPEDKLDFMDLGVTRYLNAGEGVNTAELTGASMVMVETGECSVWLNNTSIDYMQKFDTWGEESFILSGSMHVTLRAEGPTTLKVFERKGLLDYFAYRDEKLLKRFILNITSDTFYKWRKAIQRIIMLKLVVDEG